MSASILPLEPTVSLDRIEDAIAAFAAGELIVVVDDEDRENEGDLIMAAEKAKPEQVAFMIRHTSGILCTPLPPEDAARLHLTPMVQVNNALQETAFTVSIDYKHGLTTGISADERTATIRALANNNSGAADFVRPGHIFPLIGKPGGVLVRSGHTEAAIDLARLAGLSPVGLLAELVNDDGTVKRLPELMTFAKAHKLRIVSIADLIQYRQRFEKLVSRVDAFEVQLGDVAAQGIVYATPSDNMRHVALCIGDLRREPVAVRIHRESVFDDVFGAVGAGRSAHCKGVAVIRGRGTGVSSISARPGVRACVHLRHARPEETHHHGSQAGGNAVVTTDRSTAFKRDPTATELEEPDVRVRAGIARRAIPSLLYSATTCPDGS
jgi:3,4-dihydroxy 2-butanone 4-phosphate synthase/GTP cyclohydrolase II